MTGYLEGFDSTFEFLHFVRPLIRFASRHKLTTTITTNTIAITLPPFLPQTTPKAFEVAR